MHDAGVQPVTVALPTLGCKANRCDSDALARALIARGYVVVPAGRPADIYIINTCTVTGEADAKSRKALRRALRLNADALIVVTGCYATLEAETVAGIAGVDAVVSLADQRHIPETLLRLRPPTRAAEAPPGLLSASTARTRAMVKVQDGCDRRCAYCAVTLARGELRSRPVREVAEELRALVEAGAPEIVLTGIRLDAYGVDHGESLAELLDATRDLGIPRLRLSSLEPLGITPRLVRSLAEHPALCRHFHLCLQSGDDEVLRAMRRGYTVDEYRALIAALRAAMADATFTTDVIVGFPGETEAAFANTCALVDEVGFIKVHTFKFSPRPHTEAARLPDRLPDTVKDARAAALAMLERRLFRDHARRLLGTRVSVLVERGGRHGDGLTPHYMRVRAPFPRAAVGQIVPVTVGEFGDNFVRGVTEYPGDCSAE